MTPLNCPGVAMEQLTVNHRQSSFVQKPEPPVFEQPDGQDGEGEEHDEDE